VYLIFIPLIAWTALLTHSDTFKDDEIMVLRHRLAGPTTSGCPPACVVGG
jgi:hypothetical protein